MTSKKLFIATCGAVCLTTLVLASGEAQAIGIGGGMTSGPDDSFDIDLFLVNEPLSTSSVTSININGSTATAFPLVWDELFDVTPPPGASVLIAGEDTQLLSFNFTSNPDGFNPGETFSFGVDPDTVDDPSAGIIISDLIGVEVTFNFEDLSKFVGVFVNDPIPGAGLVLQEVAQQPSPGKSVPEPTSILGLTAFAAFGVSSALKSKHKLIITTTKRT
jgi:hypothetical protein